MHGTGKRKIQTVMNKKKEKILFFQPVDKYSLREAVFLF